MSKIGCEKAFYKEHIYRKIYFVNMIEPEEAKKLFSLAEKIQCCRESGLTVSEWCRENNINLKTYYYHLRKIRKKLCEQIAVPVMTVEDTNPTVKLRIADVTAEITDSTSEQMITMIIRAIRNA